MNLVEIEAEMRAKLCAHYQGQALDEKVSQCMKEVIRAKSPDRFELVLKPLKKAILELFAQHDEALKKQGERLLPYDATSVLMDLLCRNICHSRDPRLSMELIMKEMLGAFAENLIAAFRDVTTAEAKTQPGG